MPTITVDLGQRTRDSFERAVQVLKSHGFGFNRTQKLWFKHTESIHVNRLLQTLRDVGIRGRVQQDKPKGG